MRLMASSLLVAQNLYIVKKKPGWSAQFIIECFNKYGKFSVIDYEFSGEEHKDY